MARQWVKEELKKDYLALAIEKIVYYVKNHRDTLLIAIGAVVVIVVVVVISITRMNKANKNAQEQVGYASLYLRYGFVDQTIQICDQVLQAHPGGLQGGFANYFKAEALYLKKDYAGAVPLYRNAYELLKKREDFGPMILISMASANEALGKYQEAIDTYKQVTETYSAHYLVPEAQLGMGRCNEYMGNVQNAISYYQTVASLYPSTPYKETADWKLKLLSQGIIQPSVPVVKPIPPRPVPGAEKPTTVLEKKPVVTPAAEPLSPTHSTTAPMQQPVNN